jgi:hypothetical protein
MKSVPPLFALAACAVLLHPVIALAGLATEDAELLGRGECEFEVVGTREGVRGEPAVRGASAQVGCGLGLRSQIALFGERAHLAGERSEEVGVEGKTALRELTDDRAGIVVVWAATAARPGTGSLRHEGTEVKAAVTQPLGDWFLHANLGWTRSEADKLDSTIWSVAAERTALGPIDAMAEVFGDDRSAPWINAGLSWTVKPDTLFVEVLYGVQMDGLRARLATVELKYAF